MTLDEQYQKTIDDQRAYLAKLQEDFNKTAAAAKEAAEKKLKENPNLDDAGKEAILKEQKEVLDTALSALKAEVAHSTRQTMKILEGILTQKEQAVIADLEQQLQKL